MITSPKKPGKENLLDGKTDSNADPSLSVPSPVKENPRKKKRKGVEVMQDDTGVSDKALNEKKPKKSKLKASKEIVGGNANDGEAEENTTQQFEDNQSRNVEKNELNSFKSVSSLPTGSELVTIAGVDLPKEDAGNALQLLEFCYTFGKVDLTIFRLSKNRVFFTILICFNSQFSDCGCEDRACGSSFERLNKRSKCTTWEIYFTCSASYSVAIGYSRGIRV